MTKHRPQPRRRRVTSLDVARLAGVSQPTVSRAFAVGASITTEKRDRVLEAARQLNYVPNEIASGLATARTHIVAVISGNMDNPFYAESLQHFIRGLQATGRQVLAFTVEDRRDSDEMLRQAMRYAVDAIVVTSAHLSSRIASLGVGPGVPLVMFNRHVGESALPGVHCDNVRGAGLLARVLHHGGARRYLIVRGDPHGSTSPDRIGGFRAALEALGVPESAVEEADGDSSYEGARQVVERRWSAGEAGAGRLPDAVFAVSDIMAIGCADALRDTLGLDVPGDVQLAGFDGIREARRSPYRLTTVRQPVERMVRETIALLEAMLTGHAPDEPVRIVLPGELVPGRTVRDAHAFRDGGGHEGAD